MEVIPPLASCLAPLSWPQADQNHVPEESGDLEGEWA